jgi:SAM-dependent methyltransferase
MISNLKRRLKRVVSLPDLPPNHTDETLAWADYDEAATALEMLELDVRLEGERVLDVGCGLGGKTAYYAQQGARLAVGLDISAERASVAQSLAARHPAGNRVQVVVGDAARLPFCRDAFDRVVSTDTWEHLRAPTRALCELARVVRPGCTVSISALPYYSPWGAHVWSWIPLPWIQTLLPRRLLFRWAARIERRRHVNQGRSSAIRMDWACPDDPVHAQRLTVAALERSLPASGMTTLRLTVIPIGTHLGGLWARIARALVALPLFREFLAGLVVVVLQKPPGIIDNVHDWWTAEYRDPVDNSARQKMWLLMLIDLVAASRHRLSPPRTSGRGASKTRFPRGA